MSFLISTCSLISSSVSVITGVKQINAKVALILQPHKGVRLCDTDRRRLVSIHKRIECLIQPLNFCVLWSKDKDSCIQPIVRYAFDLVNSVIEFLDKVKFVMDDADPFTRVLHAESSSRVEYFLRELDFACTSVSMAVSVTKGFAGPTPEHHIPYVSPLALLKASKLIHEMHNRSGDLCMVSGTLLSRRSSSSIRWDPVGECSFRISQYKSLNPVDSSYLVRFSSPSVNLNFPIQTGLSFQVCCPVEVGLPTDQSAGVIIWTFDESLAAPKIRLLHRNPSGENMEEDLSRLSLDSSDDETLVVHGSGQVPSGLRARLTSTHITQGPEYFAQYAFSYPLSSSPLSPIDIVYITRLCVLEASRVPNTDNLTCSHMDASDEIITALLANAVYAHQSPCQTPPCDDVQLNVETVQYHPDIST